MRRLSRNVVNCCKWRNKRSSANSRNLSILSDLEEDRMKNTLMISGALLLALGKAQPASAQSPTDLVKQAVDALGGADALRGMKTLVTKADAKHWEPGQSNSVSGESRFLGDSTLTTSVDYANKDGASVRF